MQMSIAPYEAQIRAKNLGIAETSAVVFAATYEGGLDIPGNTDTCTSEAREGTENAYSVTCTHGTDKYVQSVTRAFRLAVPDEGLAKLVGRALLESSPIRRLHVSRVSLVPTTMNGALMVTTISIMRC